MREFKYFIVVFILWAFPSFLAKAKTDFSVDKTLDPLVSRLFVAKTNYYTKAMQYFKERKRPLRHFLDFGAGVTLIQSIYPFELTAYPFSLYINYRREKWGQTKIPLIFSFQYESLFSLNQKIHTLFGLRYPVSHDLTLFHVDFMTGFSFPLSKRALRLVGWESRFLCTHIIGPKDSRYRLYFQWGLRASLKQVISYFTIPSKNPFRLGFLVQAGMDLHL